MSLQRAAGLGRQRALRAVWPSPSSTRPASGPARQRSAWLYSGLHQLHVELNLPQPGGRCAGWVIVPWAGGLGASLPLVLAAMHRAGFATLLVDLLGLEAGRAG